MSQFVPRGWLGTSAGVFSLTNSDASCGSYIAIEDAARILEVEPDELSFIPFAEFGDKRFLTDQKLGRAWASGSIKSPRDRFQRGSAMISFDELIIMTLIEITLPGAEIEPQIMVGNRLIDFRVRYDGRSILLEFFGPYHFIHRSVHKRPPRDPRLRVLEMERTLKEECVIWPYWVQRCAANVKALFDIETRGIGSIWSTSAQFGDFFFSDSADIIRAINDRFRIERKDGIGYMYTNEVVSKPVHPILKKIRDGRENKEKLIPKGSKMPNQYWLPKQLWSLQ
jgi:hypothetical protein